MPEINTLLLRHGTSLLPTIDNKWLEKEKGIYPSHLFLLGELGLMYPGDLTFCAFNEINEKEEVFFLDDFLLIVKRKEIKGEIQIPIWKFTSVGSELLKLVNKPLDKEYLRKVGIFFIQKNGEALITRIKSRLPGGRVRYDIIEEIKVEQNA